MPRWENRFSLERDLASIMGIAWHVHFYMLKLNCFLNEIILLAYYIIFEYV
jgi:hypothetical protein